MKKSAKWFIVILVLIVISVVLTIVFINLFKDKNTDKLASNIHTVATEGYLNESATENKRMNEYLDILLSVEDKVEVTEKEIDFSTVENYKDVLSAFESSIKFFDEKMVFSFYSQEYKDNNKAIRDSFNNAQSKANQISEYYNTNIPRTENSDSQWTTWTIRTWNSCKGLFDEMINSTSEAFSKLFVVYQSSLNSKIMTNDLTYVVFREATNELTQLTKSSNTQGQGQKISAFFGKYFSESGEKVIINFNFNKEMQEKVSDILEKNDKSAFYQEFVAGFAAA